MGQSKPHRPIALVVEDDEDQRTLVTTLLEETEMSVIQCESAEAADLVMSNLAGNMSGLELADKAKTRYPDMTVIITSGRACAGIPKDTLFMPKPWRALDILMEAEKTRVNGYH